MKVDQRHLRRLLEHGDHNGFIEALEPLCHREAKRTAPNGLEYEDLLQEARIAVAKVAQIWDPARGANPLTLAVTYVRHALWRETKKQLTHTRSANIDAAHLDAPTRGFDGEGATLGSLIPVAGPTVEEAAEQRDELATLAERLSVLPPEVRRAGIEREQARGIPTKAQALVEHVARGGDVEERVAYLSRDHKIASRQTPATVSRTAELRNPGCIAVAATKRKLLDGRERAPQGRPRADGALGDPVWRVDLICPLDPPAEAAA